MISRSAAKMGFLDRLGWTNAKVAPLAGDASSRSYDRVIRGDLQAVLMDAPPDRGEHTAPFIKIAQHLSEIGLHPPEIFGADPEDGFLLLEDLGNRVYAIDFEADPTLQFDYYREALAVLKALHAAPSPDLPAYGRTEMAEAAGLAAKWYAGAANSAPEQSAAMDAALGGLDWSRTVPVLRDYHAENLIWCPDETGLRRVGLLDFQDAGLGHPVYDAASLLQDARRDLAPGLVTRLTDETWSWFSEERAHFDQAFAVLSAQRALRILGVFARLSLHFDKPGYVDLIPRVWGQLQGNLTHPALHSLARQIRTILPEPEDGLLRDLKSRAGTCPTR